MKKVNNEYAIYNNLKPSENLDIHVRLSSFKDIVMCALTEVSNENLYAKNSFEFFKDDVVINEISNKKYLIQFSIKIPKKANEDAIKNQIDEEIKSAIKMEFPEYKITTEMKVFKI